MDVIYYVATSLDGYIATPDGGVEWLNEFNSPYFGFMEFYASIDAVLMGSHTYEFALEMGGGGGGKEDETPTWAFTSRDLPLTGPNVTLTDADPREVVDEVRAAGHKRAWLMGGGELAGSFRRRGLITHYQIYLIPIVLGAGIPLFGTGYGGGEESGRTEEGEPEPTALRLAESKAYPNGVVLLDYRAAASA